MKRKSDQYWKSNIKIISSLLAIWFIASFGFGIIFSESLDQIKIGGFKLGFWFAQQGSIYVFVLIIFLYVWLMLTRASVQALWAVRISFLLIKSLLIINLVSRLLSLLDRYFAFTRGSHCSTISSEHCSASNIRGVDLNTAFQSWACFRVAVVTLT